MNELGKNPLFEAHFDKMEKSEAARVGTSLTLDQNNPDQIAESMDVGRELGVPHQAVLGAPDLFKTQLGQKRTSTALTSAPNMRDWLGADPVNGSLAKDDLDNLTWFEKKWAQQPSTQFGRGLKTGALGVGQVGAGSAAIIPQATRNRSLDNLTSFEKVSSLDPSMTRFEVADVIGVDPQSTAASMAHGFLVADPDMRQRMIDGMVSRVVSSEDSIGFLSEQIKGFSDQMQGTQGRAVNFTSIEDIADLGDWIAFNSGQSIPFLAAIIGAGALGGAPAAGGAGYALGVGDINSELIKQGITDKPEYALGGAIPYAALEALGPGGTAFRGVGKKVLTDVSQGYFKRLGREVPKQAIGEFINEAGQEIIKDITVSAGGGETIKLDNKALLKWFNAGMAGAVGGATFAPITARQAQLDADMDSAESAGLTASVIDELDAMAAASKLKARSSDKFLEALNASGGRDAALYVPAADMQEYFQGQGVVLDDEMLAAWGVEPSDFAEKVASGGDLAIPSANYAARISGTDAAGWFRENSTFSVGEFSLNEAAEFNAIAADEQQAAFEGAQDESARLDDERADDVKVYDSVFSQLRSAGRSPDVAKNEAEVWRGFFGAMASRTADASQLADIMGVKIQGPQAPEVSRRRDKIDSMINTLRAKGPDALKPSGAGVLEFIRGKGGITDRGGDIEAMDVPKGVISETRAQILERESQPSLGGLSPKASGSGLDDIGRALIDEGYFPEYMGDNNTNADGTVIDEAAIALQAISEAMSGRDRFIDGQGPDKDLSELSELLNDQGIDLSLSNDEIAAALQGGQEGGQTYDQFAGPYARTADKSAMDRAVVALADGADAETVRAETGWFVGPDNALRFEISDSEMEFMDGFEPNGFPDVAGFSSGVNGATGSRVKLSDVIKHDAVLEAYPRIGDTLMFSMSQPAKDGGGIVAGGVDPRGDMMVINSEFWNDPAIPESRKRETIIHEIQHLIQMREGRSKGADLSDGIDAYKRNMGEIEARTVQKRGNIPQDHLSLIPIEFSGNEIDVSDTTSRAMVMSNDLVERARGRLKDEDEQQAANDRRQSVGDVVDGMNDNVSGLYDALAADRLPDDTDRYTLASNFVNDRDNFVEYFGQNTFDLLDGLIADVVDPKSEPFKAWFGDSKVVDADGAPLVVYHRTGAEFDAFDPDKSADGMFYFTTDVADFDSGNLTTEGDGVVVEAYLSLQNPAPQKIAEDYGFDYSRLSSQGYDGMALDGDDLNPAWFVAFDPTQIKSIHNRGTFDANDPRILFQDMPGANLVSDDVVTFAQSDDVMPDVGLKVGKSAKFWRGVNDTSGGNSAEYGEGLYVAGSKSEAGTYVSEGGRLIEMDRSDLPQNPIRFRDHLEWQMWRDRVMGEMGLRGAREHGPQFPDISKLIGQLYPDVDGVQISTGKDAIFVNFGGDRVFYQSATPADVDGFVADLKDRLGLRDLSMFASGDDLKINMIAVEKDGQKKGTGSQAMTEISAFADRHRMRLTLTAGQRDDGFGTTSQARLKKFYKRFGFVENKGRNKDFSISENMYREPALNQPAYHGSPQVFDKFSTDSVGTGTGGMAYGWGLYFSGRKGLAEAYRDAAGGSEAGRTYKVEIPDNDALMDWDAPISEQSDAIKKFMAENLPEYSFRGPEGALQMFVSGKLLSVDSRVLNGRSAYLALRTADQEEFGGTHKDAAKAVSLKLRDAGVLGHKMSGGHGDTNFVIYDEDAVKILEFDQNKRGSIVLPSGGLAEGETVINLFERADLSTFLHESGHFFLEAFTALAVNPSAPVALQDDLGVIHKFLGVEGGASLTVDQHEKWARGFEAYVMEGKAPSLELASAFSRFKSWLTRIYKTARGLNVTINNDIRAVMDRMLATDEQIAAMRDDLSMNPLFTDAGAAGMSDVDFSTYQRMAQRSAEQAEARLMKTTMAKIKRETLTWYKAEKKAVTDEVTDQANRMPVYRLTEWLGSGRWLGEGNPEIEDLRMDRGVLSEQFHAGILEEISKTRLGGSRAIYKKDGVRPEQVAEFFGFGAVEDMIGALQNAGKRKDFISAETDRIMDERHGDPLNDGSIEEAATMAVHSDQQAATVATEVRTLAKRLGRPTGNIKAKFYRQRAKAMLGRMSVREASRATSFLQAERSSARAAERAFAKVARGSKGSNAALAEAMQAKEQQLLNSYLYKEAMEFEKTLNRGREKMRSYDKKSVREKVGGSSVDPATGDLVPGYIEQIDQLLERFDFRKRTERDVRRSESLRAYVDRMIEDGRGGELAIDDRLMNEAMSKHYTRLTVDELHGLFDTVANIDHTGRFKKTLQDRRRKRDLDEVASSVAGAVRKRFGRGKSDKQTGKGKNFLNLLWRIDTVAADIDQEEMGAFYDAIKRDLDDGAALEQKMNVASATKISELFDVYTSKEKRDINTAKAVTGGNGKLWTKQQVLSLAMNMGNPNNIQRILDHRVHKDVRLTQKQLDATLATLEKRDWDFVQSVWDYLETFGDDLAAVHERRTGFKMKRVEAQGFTNDHGSYRGGYYPISYDPKKSKAAMKDEESAFDKFLSAGRGAAATVADGMTQSRQNTGGGRALNLDLSVMLKHVRDTTRVISMSEAVDNTARVINHNSVVSAFQDAGQTNLLSTLGLFLQDVATGPVYNDDPINGIARIIKNNFTMSRLAFNFKTVALQVTGLGQSAAVVGKKNMLMGFNEYRKRPNELSKEVMEKSAFMAERQTTFQKDVYDQANDLALSSPLSKRSTKVKNAVSAWGFAPMIKVQFYAVDMPTWVAAYQSELKKNGGDDGKAVHYADRMVDRSQGGGLMTDRNALERGTVGRNMRQSDFIRLWTTLGGYMVTKMNRGYLTSQSGVRNFSGADTPAGKVAAAANLATDLALLYVFEAAMMGLAYSLLTDDEDDEDIKAFMVKETFGAGFGGIPFVRESVSSFNGYGAGGVLASALETPSKVMTQIAQGDNDKSLRRSVGDAVGLMTGMPTTQAMRIIEEVIEGSDGSIAEALIGRNPLSQ